MDTIEMPRHTRVADYLLAVHRLSSGGTQATTGAVAIAIGVSNGTASSKLKELAELDLVDLRPYVGARLTPAGVSKANAVRQRQSLIELFLIQTLGLSKDAAVQQAWAIEFCTTESTIAAIRTFLGDPKLRSLCE